MKFYIKPTQEHPNEKGEYALIQEGTLCLFTGQSYEETANEEKFKIAFNKLSSKQKEQDFIECEILNLTSYLSSITPLSLDFFNLTISKQDDKNSLQVVAQIDNHQFKTKQEDNNNKNINLGYSYDDFIQTLLAHINSKETINIPLNVKYQKRILILIERFKETTESTLARMNIFIDGKRVDSMGPDEFGNMIKIKKLSDGTILRLRKTSRTGGSAIDIGRKKPNNVIHNEAKEDGDW